MNATTLRSIAALTSLGLLAGALGSSGCSDGPTNTPIRSLNSSGPLSFVCLGAPESALADMALPLSDCARGRTGSIDDYSVPHLYALVTQTLRGEVAVVDLTTAGSDSAIIDQDQSVPGASFLPVGTQPTAIVSTPAGMATFVSSAEPGFQAIYALPSNKLRNAREKCKDTPDDFDADCQAPRLSSWPACRLPSTPGDMTIAVDPADDNGDIRPSCDAAYGAEDADATCCTDKFGAGCADPVEHCHGDLSLGATKAGTPGRYKLLVTLPTEGGIAVIDAQDILDQDAGAFQPCTIDRWLPLKVELPPPGPAPDPPDPTLACVEPPAVEGPFADAYQPFPAAITHDGDRLYIADKAAPVIHRVDLPTPCEPQEIAPLVTSSTEDPSRVVTTDSVAVSPLTLDLKRYLYAIDHIDGSIMVYDVSDGSNTTRPLERRQAATNPFQPSDRVRFGAPPREIIIVQHQIDTTDPQTGATVPVRCDPEPNSSGPGTRYRTTAEYNDGAGPGRLRGVFAFALLATGDIVVIDIDDYDAACRGPVDQHALFGCSEPLGSDLQTSKEYSCNVVEPHAPRATRFLLNQQTISSGEPGLLTLPVLFDEGSLVKLDSEEGAGAPRMRATTPVVDLGAIPFQLQVGNDPVELNSDSGQVVDSNNAEDPSEHTLAMNLVDPRAHIIDQEWTVTYEGALPGSGDRFAEVLPLDNGRFQLRESTIQFCSQGVTPQNALAAELESEGMTPARAAQAAAPFADFVELLADVPVETDSYWTSDRGTCNSVDFSACDSHYGTSVKPSRQGNRDLRIIEATEDSLEVEHRATQGNADAALKCCFPGVVEFRVRAGNQWLVQGNQVGFLHHGDRNDEGFCRPSCDPNLALLNGRVFDARDADGYLVGEVTQSADQCVGTVPAHADDGPFAFRNPFFRFSISAGSKIRRLCSDSCDPSVEEKDNSCEPTETCSKEHRFCVPENSSFPCGVLPSSLACALENLSRPHVPQLSATRRDMQFRFTTQGGFRPLVLSMVIDAAAVQPTAAQFLAPTGELVISDGQLTGITFIDLNVLAISRQYN